MSQFWNCNWSNKDLDSFFWFGEEFVCVWICSDEALTIVSDSKTGNAVATGWTG